MAVIISGISVKPGTVSAEITEIALKKCGISPTAVRRSGIYKLSLDARKQSDIKTVAAVWVEMDKSDEARLASRSFSGGITVSRVDTTPFKPTPKGTVKPAGRIAVCGFGPAGMFAALTLAECGYKPLVLERGEPAEEREKAVNDFWKGGALDTRSNVQFGEGGAGTFSDGKLTTRIKDPLCRYVLERFVSFGAPAEILTTAKPHIGTDKLVNIVRSLRERVIALGGEVRFLSQVTDIDSQKGRITSVTVNGSEKIPVSAVILAVGHSARDTFILLNSREIAMTPKPFAVGARIEHTQESVNESLYGKNPPINDLPPGEYSLAHTENGRGVYTFCMCPGGFVVPSQSSDGSVVTNGMSRYDRSGANANSAIVCSVSPFDYGNDVLAGVQFAAKIEHRAFIAAGSDFTAPCVTVGSFLDESYTMNSASVFPTYFRGVTPCSFEDFLPRTVTDAMRRGLRVFSRKMRCFGDMGAILTAPETRTSSPVRILRGDDKQSPTLAGLYPCGEGAGYAGGIMSAAVDGIKQACAVMDYYRSD